MLQIGSSHMESTGARSCKQLHSTLVVWFNMLLDDPAWHRGETYLLGYIDIMCL